MKRCATAIVLILGVTGCDQTTVTNPVPANRDNTAVNERDRDPANKSPIAQNENQSDIDMTANIRKRVVDAKMSVNATNIKIITQDGKVTLRGPVETAAEKKQVEDIAHDLAGADNVDSQIEVKQ
jgi:hyperosmotically inducible periplasmic protein